MTDYSALRRLAHEASETEMDWLDRDWLSGIMADDWADYVAAIDPQVVIDLIDENERLDRESHNTRIILVDMVESRDQLKDENDRLRQGVAGDFDLDAWIEWAKEAAKLRAENEALRKSAGQGINALIASRKALMVARPRTATQMELMTSALYAIDFALSQGEQA